MRVVGIDPGFGRCGVAVLERCGGVETIIFSTCIETVREDSFYTRAKIVGTAFEAVMDEHQPTALAVETLFFNTNQKTALQVAEMRGILIYEGLRRGLPVFEYSPQTVKLAITGFGASDKRAVAAMVHKIYKLEKALSQDDEYDAIAVAATHLAHQRNTHID